MGKSTAGLFLDYTILFPTETTAPTRGALCTPICHQPPSFLRSQFPQLLQSWKPRWWAATTGYNRRWCGVQGAGSSVLLWVDTTQSLAGPPHNSDENFLLIHPDPRAEKTVKLKLRWAREESGVLKSHERQAAARNPILLPPPPPQSGTGERRGNKRTQ